MPKKHPLCHVSGKMLSGVRNAGAKSWKTTSRRWGGALNQATCRNIILQAALIKNKEKTMDQIDLSIRKYVQELVGKA